MAPIYALILTASEICMYYVTDKDVLAENLMFTKAKMDRERDTEVQ